MIKGLDGFFENIGINVDKFNGQMVFEAIIILVVCLIVTKLLLGILDRFLDRSRIEETLHGFIHGITKYVLLFITILLVLQTLDINMTSFIAVLSVVGLAVSLAVQGALSNFAGGVIILITKPFKVGDYVVVDGGEGTIQRITLIHTQILTPGGKMLFVPNSDISEASIQNYTYGTEAEGNLSKIEIKVGASYESPVEKVHEALEDACAAVPDILDSPAPFINISAYLDSNIEYVIRAWTKPDTAVYWKAYYALMEEIMPAFERHGVEMAYSHLNVHLVKSEE